MRETEQEKAIRLPRQVTLSKCSTPSCQNGIRASRETYCAECLTRQKQQTEE